MNLEPDRLSDILLIRQRNSRVITVDTPCHRHSILRSPNMDRLSGSLRPTASLLDFVRTPNFTDLASVKYLTKKTTTVVSVALVKTIRNKDPDRPIGDDQRQTLAAGSAE